MKKKTVALLMALVLIFGVAAGGTVAWLTDKTETITNTFIDSDINIKLEETTSATYKMVPGGKITKDPKVTVEKGSEACWLFVELQENLGAWSDNLVNGSTPKFTNYISYTVLEGWTKVPDTTGVYYRKVAATTDQAAEFYVLKGEQDADVADKINQLTVNGSVTKAMMDEIDGIVVDASGNVSATDDQSELNKRPTLTVTAYAIQQANIDEDDIAVIWNLAKSNS